MKTPEAIWYKMLSQDHDEHEIMTVEDAYSLAEAYHAQFEQSLPETKKVCKWGVNELGFCAAFDCPKVANAQIRRSLGNTFITCPFCGRKIKRG